MVKIPKDETELEMYRQSVIKQYKLQHPNKPLHVKASNYLLRFRRIMPINIAIGIIASIIYISINGWASFGQTILMATIWITLVATIMSAVVGKK